MADIKLDSFRNNLKDLARPNRFLMIFTRSSDETLSYLAKGAQLPGRVIDEIQANWQGMQAKIAGDPTFNDFTVTFINDYELKARKFVEKWLEDIAAMSTNVRSAPSSAVAGHHLDQGCRVQQLGRTGEVLREYKLVNAWPADMADIDLNMDSTSQMAEFTVTFKYDYFEVVK